MITAGRQGRRHACVRRPARATQDLNDLVTMLKDLQREGPTLIEQALVQLHVTTTTTPGAATTTTTRADDDDDRRRATTTTDPPRPVRPTDHRTERGAHRPGPAGLRQRTASRATARTGRAASVRSSSRTRSSARRPMPRCRRRSRTGGRVRPCRRGRGDLATPDITAVDRAAAELAGRQAGGRHVTGDAPTGAAALQPLGPRRAEGHGLSVLPLDGPARAAGRHAWRCRSAPCATRTWRRPPRR